MKRFALSILLSMISFNVWAAQPKGLATFSADFGGDTLVDVTYTDGSKADIDAGRGISIGGGVELEFIDNASLQALFSWKFTTISQANNGNATWTRLPIDILGYYRMNKLRLGAGISYSLSNKLEGTGAASSITQDFDNALGYIIGVEYNITPAFSLISRYTFIEYSPTSGGESANGNNFGAGINWYFGPR